MAQNLKAMREELAPIVGKIKEMAARQADWTAEDKTNWAAINSDYDARKAAIANLERVEAVEADLATRANPLANRKDPENPPPPPEAMPVNHETRCLAMQGWLCSAQHPEWITERHVQAAKACGVHFGSGEFVYPLGGVGRTRTGRVLADEEIRANLGKSVDVSGGYTVPEGFVPSLETALKAYGGVRNVAEIMRTSNANPLPWPTMDDTSNSGELLGENVATSTTGTIPSFGSVVFGAQKFSSKLIPISSELLRDSAFNMAAEIGRLAGIRLGRIMSARFTTGSGAGVQPTGIMTRSTAGLTTASATAITFDEIIKLIYSVDVAYRTAPGAGFMMADTVVGYLRMLKDGMGRYLWTYGDVTKGEPDRCWGYPVQVSLDMDATTASTLLPVTAKKHVLFGDLSKFKIREVGGVRLMRLVERFAEYDQTAFIAFMEADSDLIDAGTHPVKHLLQA